MQPISVTAMEQFQLPKTAGGVYEDDITPAEQLRTY